MTASAIYKGLVLHHRTGGIEHRFSHRLPWFLIDLQNPQATRRKLLFGVNTPGIMSFYDADHGARDGSSFRQWLADLLSVEGLHNLRFSVLCLPRIFGYVFNPISIVYCFTEDGELKATVFEVHNTFGESCAYLQVNDRDSEPAAKLMHVSPFFSMQGHYEFIVTPPGQDLRVAIRYFDDAGASLFAGFQGHRRAFSTRNLIRTIISAPFAAIGVTADIHWQALILWMKGLRIYHKQKREIQHG